MTQLKHEPESHRGHTPRTPLRIIDETEPVHTGSQRSTGAGIAWSRAYQRRLRFTDTVIIIATTAAAFFASFAFTGHHTLAESFASQNWFAPGFIIVLWITALAGFHTRDRRTMGAGASEYKNVTGASMVTFGVSAIIFLLLDAEFIRRYFIVALPVGVTALIFSRWLWRRWLTRQRRFGNYLSRAIVVGHREDVEYVVARINERMGASFTVVGVVSDDDHPSTKPKSFATAVLRDFGNVAESAAALDADAVIVAGQPSTGSDFIRTLAWQLEGTAMELILASQLADVAGPRIHFRPVEGLPLIHVEIPQFEGGKHIIKRAMDLVGSAIGMLILVPLLAVLAILIRLDSPGPALFLQQRVGRNGKEFRMLKFRSMVASAPAQRASVVALNDGKGPLFKMKNDPRVTRLGRVLRKYSLDELPQLWNVLLGDMSLVGPRPPLPEETLGYKGAVRRRLYINPGLTGMWQINGRSDLNWEESVRLDLYYVENWSLIGDLVILWRTIKIVIHPVGAY